MNIFKYIDQFLVHHNHEVLAFHDLLILEYM